MGKPAARSTDMAMTCNDPADLPVGTVIAVGTVLINKLPAAKQNDQVIGTDIHIIMIPAPPGPPIPTPLPHPFVGMINGGLSSSVNIMGMAAATQGSTADNTPPHIPQGGPFQKPPANKATIQLGSPTVMIGNGGGGGSGQTGSGQAEQATSSAATTEGHRLDVKFVDKGGKPIVGPTYTVKGPDGEETSSTLAEKVKMTGVKEGDHEISIRAITKAEWSPDKARAGEKIKLLVEAVGVDDGTKVTLEVWKRVLDMKIDLPKQ